MSIQAVKINQNGLSEADITNYWQHYGLKHDPFATEVSDENYCAISRWEEYLDLLQFLCHYKNVMLVVTGTNCSGKTTLLKQFNKQLSESARICEIKANASFTIEKLVKALSEQFSLSLNPDASAEEQLDDQISSLQESPKICLLVIDDAHLLSNQIIRNLIYLVQQQSESQMKLHIVLFGEPHLQTNLTRLCQAQGAGDDILHTLNIGLLSLEETESYLEHRLLKAGFDEMPLVQTVINRIYKLSAGAPGRINRIARRTLLNDLIKSKPEEAKGLFGKNQTMLLGASLFLLLAAALVITFNWSSLGDRFSVLKYHKPQAALPLVTKPVALAPAQPNAMEPGNTATANVSNPQVPAITQAIPELTTEPVKLEAASPASNTAKPDAMSTPSAQGTITVTSTESSEPITLQDAKMLQALTPVNDTVIKNDAVKPTEATLTKAAKPVKKAVVVPKKATKSAPVKAATSSESHLLSIPATSFGLQLSGLSKEAAVKRFIAQNNFGDKVSYYHTLHNGKDWYVIIYGQFKTLSEAKAAIKELPESVQALKPWVRPFKSIHNAIHEAQKIK